MISTSSSTPTETYDLSEESNSLLCSLFRPRAVHAKGMDATIVLLYLPATFFFGATCSIRTSPVSDFFGTLLCIQLVGLFDEVDDDHDGYLHFTEFLAATLEADGKEVTDERLAEAFDQLDMDDSGFISTQNLEEFLGKDSKVRARLHLVGDGWGVPGRQNYA